MKTIPTISLFDQFDDLLQQYRITKAPQDLYEPVNYIMGLGGKRIRPLLCLMACEMFGGKASDAYHAALAIEYFHNFTLLHDDVMDDAPIRRGQATVHEKYDVNTAILSGDATLIKAYEHLSQVPTTLLPQVMRIFNQTALEVCEGQSYDMAFENTLSVKIADYINMIALKTAVLLGASLQIGALIGKASPNDAQKMYDFGRNIGIAFQLQDDILDTFGNQETFGKRIGGDILHNKKTFLLVTALAKATEHNLKALLQWLDTSIQHNETEKIKAVQQLYTKLHVKQAAEAEMERYYQAALQDMAVINKPAVAKKILLELSEKLMKRKK